MERLKGLVRPHVLKLNTYSSARDDFNGVADIYLDANENPFGSVTEGNLNRYPDPHQSKLKAKLSEIKSVEALSIFLGNGSDEPIELLIRAFCEPGVDNIVNLPPTYGMYKVSANVNNVGVKSIPLTRKFEINSVRLQSELTDQDKIIFLCSPNNPTGNLINEDSIIALIKNFHGIVVIDEAYIDFADQSSFLNRLGEYPNLVVLQTFSKAWGLAAIRLGVAYAHPFVIEMLNKIKPPYNIAKGTQEIGYHALTKIDQKNTTVQKIIDERQIIERKISRINYVEEVFASEANFLLVRFKDHQKVGHYLQANGVITRDRSRELYCENCLRITVGTSQENQRLLQLLEDFQ